MEKLRAFEWQSVHCIPHSRLPSYCTWVPESPDELPIEGEPANDIESGKTIFVGTKNEEHLAGQGYNIALGYITDVDVIFLKGKRVKIRTRYGDVYKLREPLQDAQEQEDEVPVVPGPTNSIIGKIGQFFGNRLRQWTRDRHLPSVNT